ncbi:Sec-independent protein translocase subunit TatA [Spiractinospora alimapuensis]|uniref:Sec-independent protein translocase subunit TatA n=1 Tax=Spiractinospora alimapuensis TaxID=2820884 RepID=UPI001F34C205|nr:Sec-independent protein translocase subunit TatA [Spiractinospora alimapuensis]QVQ52522.1 Sec-independent protein translocase subunit TatA [Spiractinospora alimapuensis]
MGLDARSLLILALIAILLFGAKKLPDLARSLGRSMRILKSETKGLDDETTPETGTRATPPGSASAQGRPADHAREEPDYPELPARYHVVEENEETGWHQQGR